MAAPPHPPPQPSRSLAEWTAAFAAAEVPVLRLTVEALGALRERAETVTAREIGAAVLGDPLMTLKVLAGASQALGARSLGEVETVEQTVILFGVPPFFRAFGRPRTVEDALAAHPRALLGLLRVVHRARVAAGFAADWAARRNDVEHEEITIAALLHDLAEMLLWCFAPQAALRLRDLLASRPGLRSTTAQRAVLGIELNELELALARRWRLPELLVSMLDDQQPTAPRARNVLYAVRLARHLANGWDDPALPDDFREVAVLLNTTPERVRQWIGAPDPSTADR